MYLFLYSIRKIEYNYKYMVIAQSKDITTIARFDDITEEELQRGDSDHVVNHYWYLHPVIIEKLVDYCKRHNCNKVIDVGCSGIAFQSATHCVDFSDEISFVGHVPTENKMKIDIDFQQIPMYNKFFDFCYCRHTLEDIQNPDFSFQEMVRCSRRGYIETPSPLIEVLKRVDALTMNGDPNLNYCGYIHHRYIVWTNRKTNTIYFLPKYPIVEFVKFTDSFMKRITYIANKYPVYWNNYYVWDDQINKPNVFVYKNGVNFEILNDYSNILYEAIMCSIENTHYFINSI
jgi:hypothetical protein